MELGKATEVAVAEFAFSPFLLNGDDSAVDYKAIITDINAFVILGIVDPRSGQD